MACAASFFTFITRLLDSSRLQRASTRWPCRSTRYSQRGSRKIHKATPLTEIYDYRRKEHQEGEYLQREEYAPAFLSWATKYLSRDPAFIISAGSSLDGEIIQKIDTQTSIARKKQEQQKTQMFSNEKYELQSFDGKPVVVHLNGTVKLTKRLPQKPLRFHMNS